MTFKELKDRYELAKHNNEEIFIIDGCEIFTDYAKYSIQYLKQLGFEDHFHINFGGNNDKKIGIICKDKKANSQTN